MNKKIVISSSLKFKDIIKTTMINLEKLGFNPLFPNLNKNNKNISLTIEEKNRLALDHYKAIEKSDAIYFILPKGYIGTSCKIELGYALALKKPIYFSELTNDIGIDSYPKKIISLKNLIEFKKEFN